MPEKPIFESSRPVLWQLGPYAREQVVTPRSNYTFNNRRRNPAGDVIAQLTLEGRLQYTDSDGEQYEAKPGELLFFALGEPTRYALPQPRSFTYRCMWCHLLGAGLHAHIQNYRERHGSIVDLRRATLRKQYDKLIELADPAVGHEPVEVAVQIHRFVMSLFETAEQSRTQIQSPVERAIEMLQHQPCRPWSMKQVARECGCTREHLTRVFTETTGQSPGAYLAQARLQRAMELLRLTGLPMSAIAEQAGYGTTHSLTRHFHEQTGMPPTVWRKTHQ